MKARAVRRRCQGRQADDRCRLRTGCWGGIGRSWRSPPVTAGPVTRVAGFAGSGTDWPPPSRRVPAPTARPCWCPACRPAAAPASRPRPRPSTTKATGRLPRRAIGESREWPGPVPTGCRRRAAAIQASAYIPGAAGAPAGSASFTVTVRWRSVGRGKDLRHRRPEIDVRQRDRHLIAEPQRWQPAPAAPRCARQAGRHRPDPSAAGRAARCRRPAHGA